MLKLKSHTMVVDLDDFSEELMTQERWGLLLELKRRHPSLKTTMYTIPLQCSRSWLLWVKKTYPWMELCYHGSDHKDPDEWFNKTEIVFPYEDLFLKCFKAPYWRMDQITANTLDSMGFTICARENFFDVQGKKVYRYNIGKEIYRNVCYDLGDLRKINSHVQEQRKSKDGLPDIFESISKLIDGKYFLFVSELF